MLTASLLFAPHLLWLLEQDLAVSPIRYALNTTKPAIFEGKMHTHKHWHSGLWLVDLLLNRCLPALIFLLGLKAMGFSKQAAAPAHASEHALSGEHFLWLWGVLPPLAITLLGLIAGMDLQMQWGTAFALWTVPALMMLLGLHKCRIHIHQTWQALALFVGIQGCLMVLSYQTSSYGRFTSSTPHRWRHFDSQKLARELDASAREAAGGTFNVISGPTGEAGAVAIALPDKPKVLINGNLKISPWVHPQDLQLAGVVELWAPDTGPSQRTLLPSGWGWTLYSATRKDDRQP